MSFPRFLLGFVILSVAVCNGAEDEKIFTPKADMKGGWSFTADPKLPNVLIIGDSISIGYTRLVRGKLAGKANVYRPMNDKGPDNCGDTIIGLEKIADWLGGQKWDVIHFNWGLWDLCYRHTPVEAQGTGDNAAGKAPLSPEVYGQNLERLVTRMEATGAKLIWANTTVVPKGAAGRVVGDDEKYNAIAGRVMERHGIATDDLFILTKGFEGKYSKKADVHYSPEGYGKIADQVAATIEQVLPGETAP